MLHYTYVPGRTPHPIRHPDGHRFQNKQFDAANFDLDRWQDCEAYCYAIELFDQGFYWEAHELWEGCWNTAGRTGPVADFLKALIKLSAALVKAREGRAEGVRRHAHRAQELLRAVKPARVPAGWGGLNLPYLIQLAATIRDAKDQLVVEADRQSPDQVQPLMGLQLGVDVTSKHRGDD